MGAYSTACCELGVLKSLGGAFVTNSMIMLATHTHTHTNTHTHTHKSGSVLDSDTHTYTHKSGSVLDSDTHTYTHKLGSTLDSDTYTLTSQAVFWTLTHTLTSRAVFWILTHTHTHTSRAVFWNLTRNTCGFQSHTHTHTYTHLWPKQHVSKNTDKKNQCYLRMLYVRLLFFPKTWIVCCLWWGSSTVPSNKWALFLNYCVEWFVTACVILFRSCVSLSLVM